jgi:DNA-binding XRE family transcriptional regulator
MSVLIHKNHHIITDSDGRPVAAVIPYEEYDCIFGVDEDEVTIPHEVVVLYGKCHSLIRAWREHLGLTQVEVAQRMGISQPTYQQLESETAKPRQETLIKLAQALDVEVEQLYLDD